MGLSDNIEDYSDNAFVPTSSTFKTGVPDVTPPQVVRVFSTTPDGNYITGDRIDIFVEFNEEVVADTGNVVLKLKTREVMLQLRLQVKQKLIGGMGTKTLQFEHYIQSDENSEDLSYESSNALIVKSVLISNITDFAGNNAILTLPNPGAQGSLSFSSNIRIDNRDHLYLQLILQHPMDRTERELLLLIHIVY